MKSKKMYQFLITLLIFLGTTVLTLGQNFNETVNGNNQFAFDLYEKLNDKEENVFFSPYSISSALAMTYTGAENITKQEMKQVMYYLDDKESLAKSFGKLNDHIEAATQKGVQLNIANSLWCQQNYNFMDKFISINDSYYKAGIKKVDFKNNHPQVRKNINKWVEDKTNNKIKNLIKKNMLDPLTRLVLVNAIYFNGKWEHPFKEEKTKEDTFFIYSECTTKADFMNQTVSLRYYKDDLAKVIEIPYEGNEISMMVLLPHKRYGMKELEQKLNYELFQKYIRSLYKTKVKLSLPKFKFSADYDLNDPLKNLGMKTAFQKDADFSGITGKKDLFISEVVHKSFVDVNEKGTEAAAATGVVMRKSSAIMKSASFDADHPFIFLIKDNKSGSILFMGRMMNPNQE